MNLEQLQFRQQEINYNLLNLLDEQRTVVNRITGIEFSPSTDVAKTTGGLIDQIAYEQERTNDLIKELKEISETLIRHTYAPEESQGISCANVNKN